MPTFTTQQAADQLGISRQGIIKAIKRGTLKARKVGRDWQISARAIEQYRIDHLGKPGRKGK
jgi:excisionase family DNA binding protein